MKVYQEVYVAQENYEKVRIVGLWTEIRSQHVYNTKYKIYFLYKIVKPILNLNLSGTMG
jgi:hypothetical protein